MRVLLVLALFLRLAVPAMADDRLLVDARINGKSVRLAFDTGAERSVLFRRTARRLKLNVTDPPPNVKVMPGKVIGGKSEECRIQLGRSTTRHSFFVVDLPRWYRLKMAGLLAWADVRNTILWIAADTGRLSVLTALPENMSLWTKWKIRRDSRVLEIRLPSASGKEGTISIDTGSPLGVELSPRRWKQWRDKHGRQPSSIMATYTPGIGLHVSEEFWADRLAIGRFSLTNVPVIQAAPVKMRMSTNYEATLGLFALTRLDIVIDGTNDSIYTRPNPRATSRYQYNRLGAAFVPANVESDHLLAHVATGSPAQEAGIRNGDALLKIGDLDVTKWRTSPGVLPLIRFFSQPAGTELELTLMRNGKPIEAKVELKEIFPKSCADRSAPAKRPSSQPRR